MPGTRTHHITLPSHKMPVNVKNTDILSWTVLTKYHLQGHQYNITRHTETATPGQALGIAEKIEKGETGPDHSPGIADITAPAIMTCTEAALDHNKGMGTATIEAAQGDPIQHTKTTVTEPTMTHHTRSHCRSSTHLQLIPGYHSQDHSRSHSCPSYKCSKYNPHHRSSHSSRSYSNQGTQKSHLSRNRKVHIEEPPLIFTVQMIIPLTQEKNQSL